MKPHIKYSYVVWFQEQVNLFLEDEDFIDMTMALQYVARGWTVGQAVVDVLNTNEI